MCIPENCWKLTLVEPLMPAFMFGQTLVLWAILLNIRTLPL